MELRGLNPIETISAKILILGTFPSEKSLAKKEYYADGRNKFWQIMFAVFDKKHTESYDEKIRLIKENNLSLWDMIESCECDGSSSDSKIRNEKFNNVNEFISTHIELKYVFLNSDKAEKYYQKEVGFNPRISVWKLVSPSGANYAHYSIDDKIENWSAIRKALTQTLC